jgi:hypothetical protein
MAAIRRTRNHGHQLLQTAVNLSGLQYGRADATKRL